MGNEASSPVVDSQPGTASDRAGEESSSSGEGEVVEINDDSLSYSEEEEEEKKKKQSTVFEIHDDSSYSSEEENEQPTEAIGRRPAASDDSAAIIDRRRGGSFPFGGGYHQERPTAQGTKESSSVEQVFLGKKMSAMDTEETESATKKARRQTGRMTTSSSGDVQMLRLTRRMAMTALLWRPMETQTSRKNCRCCSSKLNTTQQRRRC
jgi:hypothetical protein